MSICPGCAPLLPAQPRESAARPRKNSRRGAEVVINGRKPEDVARAIDHIHKHVPGAKLGAAPGDAGTADGVAEIIRAAGGGRHPRQQCRHLRGEGRVRHSRRGLDAHFRNQRAVRRAIRPPLRTAHARQRVRAHRVHFLGVRRADPDRDDPLRVFKIRRSRAHARLRPGACGERRHGERGIARPDAHGRGGGDVQVDGRSADNPEHQREFIDTGRPTSIINGSQSPRKSPRRSRFSARARQA
jgi:hypothetical protein